MPVPATEWVTKRVSMAPSAQILRQKRIPDQCPDWVLGAVVPKPHQCTVAAGMFIARLSRFILDTGLRSSNESIALYCRHQENCAHAKAVEGDSASRMFPC